MANNSSIDGWSTCLQAFPPPSYVKCFRKTHKTLSEGDRGSEWRTSPTYSFLLLVLCATLAAAATFNFQATSQKGNRQRKGNQSRRQATWKLAQGRVAHTLTHTYKRTLTCKHKLKFPPYSARSCRSFLRFQSKNLNAYVICAA